MNNFIRVHIWYKSEIIEKENVTIFRFLPCLYVWSLLIWYSCWTDCCYSEIRLKTSLSFAKTSEFDKPFEC